MYVCACVYVRARACVYIGWVAGWMDGYTHAFMYVCTYVSGAPPAVVIRRPSIPHVVVLKQTSSDETKIT